MVARADSWLYSSKRLEVIQSANEMTFRLNSCEPKLTRKALNLRIYLPVPQTITGAQVEKTKAYEWFFVKELGKLATVTSEQGLPLAIEVAAKEPTQLFIKNIGLC